MGFLCPDCSKKSLNIIISMELGSDARSDETSLQAIACENCAFIGVAIYEESRRGASDSWHHFGYPLLKEDYDQFLEQFNSCPAPRDPKCQCDVHQQFGVTDDRGNLTPLLNLSTLDKYFILEN